MRGFDSVNSGAVLDEGAVTLDAGCGRGGPLMCGSFTASGKLSEIIAVGGQGLLESAPYEREAANDYFHADNIAHTVRKPTPNYDAAYRVLAAVGSA